RFRPHLEALEDRCVPSTLMVTNNLDSGPGSLRAEIADAHSGDTIVFDKTLNGQTITLDRLSGELQINKSLTIQGPGAGLLTISGGDAPAAGVHGSRVFEVDGATTAVTLRGLTISNGGGWADPSAFDRSSWDGYGGGILNFGTLTVSACTLSGNS